VRSSDFISVLRQFIHIGSWISFCREEILEQNSCTRSEVISDQNADGWSNLHCFDC
jgi:hypothetical protein